MVVEEIYFGQQPFSDKILIGYQDGVGPRISEGGLQSLGYALGTEPYLARFDPDVHTSFGSICVGLDGVIDERNLLPLLILNDIQGLNKLTVIGYKFTKLLLSIYHCGLLGL